MKDIPIKINSLDFIEKSDFFVVFLKFSYDSGVKIATEANF